MAENNEIEAIRINNSEQDLLVNDAEGRLMNYEPYNASIRRIYYISDIHLYHLLRNKKTKSKNDIIKIIRELVSSIVHESSAGSVILINGDTALDFSLFRAFVSELSGHNRTFIFTLGNHELWSCPDDTFDQVAEKYRTLLREKNMYLLQNDVLYFDDFQQPPQKISEQEIKYLSEDELRGRVKYARLILFGGMGFAGYNRTYNAEAGLYRYNRTIGYDREVEIRETHRIDELYKKVCNSFHGKNTIIMTHMPLQDWHKPTCRRDEEVYPLEAEYSTDSPESNVGVYSIYQQGFVYISGHTHKNYYYDDGGIRIYSDNQFGYNRNTPNAWPHLKYFEVEQAIDSFADYDNGIYEITAEEYRQFYRGKNIKIDFNRNTNIIYMLKKNGYYCFIHKALNKCLSIMNGGSLRRLNGKDINYYYKNMDLVISHIKSPLDKYTKYQNKVSNEIKEIGGLGTIHGCIIDIDYYNHVYINLIDGTITGYWASDIINKMVYPTIPALLEAQCPMLFNTYKKMIKGKNNMPIISEQTNNQLALSSDLYLDTDIYKASRQIKKMQKINENILSIWPEELQQRKLIRSR